MNQPPMGVDGNYCLCLTGAKCKKAHNRIDALEAALRECLEEEDDIKWCMGLNWYAKVTKLLGEGK